MQMVLLSFYGIAGGKSIYYKVVNLSIKKLTGGGEGRGNIHEGIH